MTPLRLCIVGCGAIAAVHSRVARTLRSQVHLLFASRDADKAERYRRRFGGIGAFGSYEEAFTSPAVDAVFLCTPHAFRVEEIAAAARGGKAILVEKPIARSLAELHAIEAAVSAAGVPCMVAENYHFKPLRRTLDRILQAGEIGEPLFVELNKTGTGRGAGWRMDAGMMGGGALLEGGVHWVNLLLNLGGPARAVVATRPRHAGPARAPFEDNLLLLVEFANGAAGKLLHSWNTRNRLAGLHRSVIYGTAGNIWFESNGLWVLVAGRRTRVYLPGLLDIAGYRAMLQEFLTAVREGRPPAMSLAVARRDLALVFAAYRSLESRAFEPVAPA